MLANSQRDAASERGQSARPLQKGVVLRQTKTMPWTREWERAYREEGLNDVRLDGAERLVSDDDEDLLLFFQVDEVTKPGFFGKSAKGENSQSGVCFYGYRVFTLPPFSAASFLPSSSISPSLSLCGPGEMKRSKHRIAAGK